MLGRLEFQRGNFEGALQVFQGIDIKGLVPRMIRAIVERSRRRKPPPRSRGDHTVHATSSVMSMHSVSLFLEAALLKARSLEELGRFRGCAFSPCFMVSSFAFSWRLEENVLVDTDEKIGTTEEQLDVQAFCIVRSGP